MQTLDFDILLDRIGIGPYQYKNFIIVSLVVFVDGFQIFDRIDRLHENLLPVNIELDDLRLHGQVKFFASLANEVHDRVVAATFRPTKVAPGAPQLRIQQVQLHRDVHGWLSVRLDSSIQL